LLGTGAGVGGLGAVGLVAGGVIAFVSTGRVSEAPTFAEKESAQTAADVATGVAIAGAAVAVVGAGLAIASFVVE
jgi:hypothetical protein